jgi:hypothetical protein
VRVVVPPGYLTACVFPSYGLGDPSGGSEAFEAGRERPFQARGLPHQTFFRSKKDTAEWKILSEAVKKAAKAQHGA